MIVELSVENIAILERNDLHLRAGLTALTGETGAGKSLLIDAIGLALGGRADSDLVRTGAARGTVWLTADLRAHPAIAAHCAALGLGLEDGLLHIQREVSAEGRSTCRIGGRLTPVSVLRQVGEWLVDLHGQHDHQALFQPEKHVDYLDAWIDEPATEAKSRVAVAYDEWEALSKRLAALQTSSRERARRIDMLQFQIDEIEAAAVTPGEFEEIEAQVSRLQHAERLADAAQRAVEHVSSGEFAAEDQLGAAVKSLESVQQFDPGLAEVVETLRSSYYAVQDAARAVRAYAEATDLDPASLEEAAARLDTLKRLRRKYGEDEAAILALLAVSKAELEILLNADENAADLEAKVSAAHAELVRCGAALTKVREGKCAEFSRLAQDEIRELALEKAVFEVRIGARPIARDGADSVEFVFSANPGEALRPLHRVASGGEISRVMLGLKVVLAGRAGVPTLIFDEIDAGLSGRAAAIVARKLQQLAEHYQVIVISHLPQIAGRARDHILIEKREQANRVATILRHLDGEERVAEVARMLAGEQVGESALANARELVGLGS